MELTQMVGNNFGYSGGSDASFGPASQSKVDDQVKFQLEKGSGFSWDDMLFAGWDDGAVYEYGITEARDFDDMMSKDGKASTILNVLTLPIRAAKWSIKAAPGDTGEAAFIDEFLKKPANMGGMSTPFDLVIAQALSARLYRKAYFEKVFKELDGRIVYDKLAYRPPATCGVRRDPETGAFRGFQQRPIRPGVTRNIMPINFEPQYSWVFINGQHRDPIRGWSDMQIVYWNYVTKLKLMFLWHTFLETQATPRTIVTAPDDPSASNAAKKVAKLRNGGVAGTTDKIGVHTLESNGRGAGFFLEAIQWLDASAAQSVLAGFTDLGNLASRGVSGSYALSKDQSDFFLMSAQAAAKELDSSITNFVIADLIKYNFGLNAAYPTFEFAPLSESDQAQLVQLITTLGVAPQMNIPFDFLGELVQKLSGYLNMDQTKIESALVEAGNQYADRLKTASDAAKMAGQATAAQSLVQQAQKADSTQENADASAAARADSTATSTDNGASSSGYTKD